MNTKPKDPALERIVRAAVHPSIGVGRVGNAAEEYYLTPQVPNPAPKPPGAYRDKTGAIKREAVQYRIYGYDEDGAVVAELTPDNATVSWRAHIANTKAAWYEFSVALDIPEAVGMEMPRRNPNHPADLRGDLIIDPGAREIDGKSTMGPAHRFDTGKFEGESVYLGELRTDEAGRLIVLGGHGVSNSPTGMPAFNPKQTNGFGNAIGWHDDVADGPVDATVSIGGRDIPVEGGWVVFGPPKYAPDIIGWRSMYEMMEAVFMENAMLPTPTAISFTKDVYPILRRMTALQWVNQGFATMFGAGGPLDFEDQALIDKLCRKHGAKDVHAPLRREIFNAFRPTADNPGANPRTWPWIYGDAFGSFTALTAPIYLTIPDRFNVILEQWRDGNFVADWGSVPTPPDAIDKVPPEDQPAALDKASLHFCAADAFHPGIEMTWPMRHVSLYQAPFRIRRNQGGLSDPDHGETLTQAKVLAPNGPLNGQGPGDISRWMLVPWQVDTAGCRSGYDPSYDPTIPTFWPAHVPNQVMSASDYAIVMDKSQSEEDRRDAFFNRVSWYDAMGNTNSLQQLTQMVTFFGEMGVIEALPGPEDLPGIPSTIYVESLPEKRGVAMKRAAMLATEAPVEQVDPGPSLMQLRFGK